MNEQLQNALSSILTSSATAVGAAKDFLVAEIPDVVYQLLLWKAVDSFIGFIFCVLSATLCVIFCKKTLKKRKVLVGSRRDIYVDAIGYDLLIGISGVASGLFMAGVLVNLTWLQIWIAPKIYLLEYAAKLVTK